MATRFLLDTKGDEALIRELADKLDAFAIDVRDRARAHAPYGTGIHVPRLKKRPAIRYHYRDTIQATTYLGGKAIHGRDVQTPTFNPASWAIASVVYTTARPLGLIYEVTGAAPHDIPIPISGDETVGGFVVTVKHPGVSRRPHFVPGLFEAASEAGVTMGGKVRVGR